MSWEQSENTWSEILKRVDEEDTKAKAHGDVPITFAPRRMHTIQTDGDVLVIEGKSFVDIAKLCFRTMTYGELMQIADDLSPTLEGNVTGIASALWGWANEQSDSASEEPKSQSSGGKDDS